MRHLSGSKRYPDGQDSLHQKVDERGRLPVVRAILTIVPCFFSCRIKPRLLVFSSEGCSGGNHPIVEIGAGVEKDGRGIGQDHGFLLSLIGDS